MAVQETSRIHMPERLYTSVSVQNEGTFFKAKYDSAEDHLGIFFDDLYLSMPIAMWNRIVDEVASIATICPQCPDTTPHAICEV